MADLLQEPLAWAVLVYGALGIICYTLAFDRARVGPATAILWVAEVALPAAVGVLVLGDGARHGWAVPATVSLLLALAACVALATSPMQQHSLRSAPGKGEA